ncbi:outer membrane beta-barrel protein [Thalassolituus sp.]|uniref:outer membrane beta-barrel protein n=1 Tax=Thalassolituus sp. TaxID=2030822 RepID=UPI003513471F
MKYVLPLAFALASTTAIADDHASSGNVKDRIYLGANISHNTIDSPFSGGDLDAAGYSIFGGLKFPNSTAGLTTSAEFGYSDTEDFFNGNGDTDINGFWLAGVAEKSLPELDPRLSAIGRLGLDFGDDDGIFLGAGIGFKASEVLGLRAEFINKDASGVYQIGALFNF